MKVNRRHPVHWNLVVCAVLALLSLSSSCSSVPEPEPAAEKVTKLRPLNVVVVTIDTLRADHLGCYGYAKVKTPVLDGIAKSGVLFENAVAQTPLTPPSHASMFTGLDPNVHGVRNTGGFVLQSEFTTLAEILQKQGWNTAAFVGAAVLRRVFGLDQGFAHYDDEMPKGEKKDEQEFPERPAGAVVDRAVDWLKNQSEKPFFIWVHVYDPHLPYEPPEPYRKQYADRPYDGEIAYADHELGRLFAAVSAVSPAENTIIAILSDHGESLGEHQEFTHGIFLYDATMRIPFILAGPGAPAGLRVKQQARTIDLLPTVLVMMGGRAPAKCQGVSLVPAFSGKPVATEYSYEETLYPKLQMGWAELRGVRTNRWKYILAPKPELYDLAQDPHELDNVIESHPEEIRDLQAQLKKAVAAAGTGLSEKVKTRLMDKRTMKQLRTLGYIQDFSPREFELTGKGADPKDQVGVLKLIHDAVGSQSHIPRSRRIALLRQALKMDPTNPAVYRHLGAAYERGGRYEQALRLYQTALRKGLRNGWFHSRIGDLYLRQGDKDQAIAAYEKAGRLNPTDVESQSNLATAYLEKGRIEAAKRVFDGLLKIGEETAAVYNGLGLIAIQEKDIAAARVNFERAVKLDPDLVEAQLNLGLIYKMTGNRDGARRCFQAFIDGASGPQYRPIIPKVRQALAELQ